MLKTKLGRFIIGGAIAMIALVWMNPSILAQSSPRPSTESQRSHRPPVSSHNGEVIKLTVYYSAAHKPQEISWAINQAVHPVDVSLLPQGSTEFQQVLVYNPENQYEIWAQGQYPIRCIIDIDGVPVDHDQLGPASKGGKVNIGDVHCWVKPL